MPPEAQQINSTVEEIAATLLTPALAPAPTAAEIAAAEAMALAAAAAEPEAVADAADADQAEQHASGEDLEEFPLSGETEEELADEVDDETSGEEVGDNSEEEAAALEAGDDEDAYLDITDEDMFEVQIDGKTEYRTVHEAKAALSMEGAIQNRLQEATETRNSVNAERDEMRLKLEDSRTEMVTAISQISGLLFQPTVALPDEALRATDPAKYLAQSDAYATEQNSITSKKQELQTYLTDQRTQQAANMKIYRDQQEVLLHTKVPELADPENAPVVAKQILKAAKHYGFHEKEIGLAYDHRLFLMAIDAGKYRALKDAEALTPAAKTVEDVLKAVSNAPRKLRSGVAARKIATRAKAKEKLKSRNKAQKSGKVPDIADFILTKR